MQSLPIILLTISYGIHIAEEYFLDFRSWVKDAAGTDMSWREFAIANTAVIILGIIASIIGFSNPTLSYIFVGLTATNALLAHIGSTIIKRRFSPGLITSVALFIPLSIWAYREAYEKGIITPLFMFISLGGGILLMGIPVCYQLIKRKMI
jgi:hypothetical protein